MYESGNAEDVKSEPFYFPSQHGTDVNRSDDAECSTRASKSDTMFFLNLHETKDEFKAESEQMQTQVNE